MNGLFTILLAEDDPNDVFFFRRAMRDAQIKNPLSVATDGQDAIDYIKGVGRYQDRLQYPLPCLLILDLKMPRKTGLEVLEWLRQESTVRTLPVIILSSSAQPRDIDRAYELGANAFLVKPASVEARTQLAKLINEFWLQLNQAPAFCFESETEAVS